MAIRPGGGGSVSGASTALTPTAIKTTAYTAVVGDLALMNVPGGGTALTLPTAPADGKQVGYRAIGATTAVPLVVTAGGADTIGLSGAASASVVLADETTVLQYQAASTRWIAVSNVKTQTSLDSRYVTVLRPSGGDDTAAINAALASGGTCILYNGTFNGGVGTSITPTSNSTLILWNATLRRANTSGVPLILNANPTPTGTPVDSNITITGIGQAVIDGNAANNPEITTTTLVQWKSTTVLFVGVTGWVFRNIKMLNPAGWGFSPQNTSGGRFTNIESQVTTTTQRQSPIQVYGKNSDLIIDGLWGSSPDDAVALLSYTKQQIGAYVYPTGANAYPGGNITNVTIRNVKGSWGVSNVGGLTRFLCGDGGQIQNIQCEDLAQAGTGYGFWFGPTTYVTTAPADFDLQNVSINNVQIRAQAASPNPIFAVDCHVSNLRVNGMTVKGAWTKLVGNVSPPASVHLFNLTFNDINFYDNPTASTTGDLLAFAAAASANGVTLTNIYCVQAASILNNVSTGANNNLLLRNIHIKTATQTIFRSTSADSGTASNITVGALSGATAYYSAAARLVFGTNCPILTAADATPVATKGSRLLAVAAKQLDGGAGTTGAEWMGNGTAWVKLADLGSSF